MCSDDKAMIIKSPNKQYDKFKVSQQKSRRRGTEASFLNHSETKKILENNKSVLSYNGRRDTDENKIWKKKETKRVIDLIDSDIDKVDACIENLKQELEFRDKKIVKSCLEVFKTAKERVLKEKKFI
jgi:hypothetical protein